VGKAFKILSNDQDRAHYDRTGDESDSPAAAGANPFARRRPGQGGVEEVDAEEIFRMFFGGQDPFGGGGFVRGPFGNLHVHHVGAGPGFARRGAPGGGGGGGGAQVQQPGPLNVLYFFFMMWMVSNFLSSSSPTASPTAQRGAGGAYGAHFALDPSPQYPHERQTMMAGVTPRLRYHVSPQMAASRTLQIPSELFRLERAVQEAHHENLKQQCRFEREDRGRAVATAQQSSDADAVAAARARGLPKCDELDRFEAQAAQQREVRGGQRR